jgi:hypothetical protein
MLAGQGLLCAHPSHRKSFCGSFQVVWKDEALVLLHVPLLGYKRSKATTMGSSSTWKIYQNLIWRLPFTTEESQPRNAGRFICTTGSALA